VIRGDCWKGGLYKIIWPRRGGAPLITNPNQPDEDDNLLDYFLVGPIRLLELVVKFPGLFLLQYLFFWNWKRIIDPHSWQVILAGLAAWVIAILAAVLVVRSG